MRDVLVARLRASVWWIIVTVEWTITVILFSVVGL